MSDRLWGLPVVESEAAGERIFAANWHALNDEERSRFAAHRPAAFAAIDMAQRETRWQALVRHSRWWVVPHWLGEQLYRLSMWLLDR